MTDKKPSAIYLVWGLVLLLIILHQDNWLWTNDYAVFGFIPMGLFFHACISIAASLTWFVAIKFAWPHELDLVEPATDGAASRPDSSEGAQ